MTKWTVTRSRYALDERWIKVRADDCVTASGVELSPFYVLEYPDFVHVAALTTDDRLILVRQYRHGLRDLSLELPGGMMDRSDPSPVETARRELKEETGFTGGAWTKRATLSVNPATFHNRLHLIAATGVEPGPASPEASEDVEIELVTRAEAIRLAMTGAIMNAQHVGMIMMALSRDGEEARSSST